MARNDSPSEQVILVDENDNEIGVIGKIEAHRHGGQLHRAFSIFVLNDRDQLLMQKRQAGKYHFGGLWSNTCCGHPRPRESVDAAAARRLEEEFGFSTDLRKVAGFLYHADDDRSGLSEREYLHVYLGRFGGHVAPDPREIESWRWMDVCDVDLAMSRRSDLFTPWFKPALGRIVRVL